MQTWLIGAALASTLTTVAPAQHVLNGEWQGETRNGSAIVLTLDVKGDGLTGTVSRNGEATAIADGKVSDKTFTFKATLSDQTESVSGEIAGDAVKVWLERQGPESAITLRRAKDK
jgi:hypothetical protein